MLFQPLSMRIQNLHPMMEEIRRDIHLLPEHISQAASEQLAKAESDYVDAEGQVRDIQNRLQVIQSFTDRRHRLLITLERLEGQYAKSASKDGAAMGERLDALRVCIFFSINFKSLQSIFFQDLMDDLENAYPEFKQYENEASMVGPDQREDANLILERLMELQNKCKVCQKATFFIQYRFKYSKFF